MSQGLQNNIVSRRKGLDILLSAQRVLMSNESINVVLGSRNCSRRGLGDALVPGPLVLHLPVLHLPFPRLMFINSLLLITEITLRKHKI